MKQNVSSKSLIQDTNRKKPKTPILLEFSHKFVFNGVKQTNKHINQTRYITSLVGVILSLFSLMNSYWDLKSHTRGEYNSLQKQDDLF